MANSSAKKQAVANTQALKIIHSVSLAVNIIFLASYFILKRPGSITPYLLCSLPAFLLQFQLERMGRPKYDTSKPGQKILISAGDDLSQEGLTEWFHDVLYLTWACDVLAPATGTNKVWYIYFAIPLYASYKIYMLLIAGRGGFLNSAKQSTAGPTQSNRQEKMEKKANKIKYTR